MTAALFLLPALLSRPAADPAASLVVAPQDGAAAAPAAVEWTGSVTLGASNSSGNSETTSVNASGEAERRGEHDRWTGKAYWNYAEQELADGTSEISARKSGASLKYDYFATKEIYYNGIAGVDNDKLADLKLRSYIGAGVGFQWREEEAFKWNSEVGLTYFSEDRYSGDDDEYPAARLANNIVKQFNDKTSLENNIEAFPSIEDVEDYFAKIDTKVKTSLSERMYAQLQFTLSYDNTPPDDIGSTDRLLTLGVGWSF
jgi:putative salt-induced outer membrane protein YdiY